MGGKPMSVSNPYVNREDWRDNPYGIDKEDFDNVIDYMEAIEEAMLYGEDDEDEFYSPYDDDDDYSYDDEEDDDF